MKRIGVLAVMTACILIAGCRNTTPDATGSVRVRLQAGSTETVSATGGSLVGASVTFSGLAEAADVYLGSGPRQDLTDWVIAGPVVRFEVTNIHGQPASFFSATITIPFDASFAGAGPVHLYTQQGTETPTRLFGATVGNGVVTATVSHFSRFWAVVPAPAPTVSTVSPQFAPFQGGHTITITGNGFLTSGPTTVHFGANAATDVVVVNQEKLTCTTPAGDVGFVDVTVTTVNGSGTLTNGLKYFNFNDPDSGTTPPPPPTGEAGTPAGTWTEVAAGTGPDARDFAGSATNSDGTLVFIFGGTSQAVAAFDSGWLLDRGTNTWTQATATDAPAARVSPVTLWTGTHFLVWGGTSALGTFQNSGGLYDPVGNSWTPVLGTDEAVEGSVGELLHFPSPDNSSYGAWVGGKLVLFGGFDVSGGGYRSDTWMYVPATMTWSHDDAATPRPGGRLNHTWVTDGTYCYTFGGFGGSGMFGEVFGDFWRFDPATTTWTEITAAGAPAAFHEGSAVWTGSDLVFWGGVNAATNTVNTGGRYNVSAGTWTALSTTGAPIGRSHAHAVMIGIDRVLFLGGYEESSNREVRGGVYNLTTNTWTVPTSTGRPSPRLGFAVAGGATSAVIFGGSHYAAGQGATYYDQTFTFAP